MFARLIRAVALLLFAGQAIVAQAHGHGQARWGTTPVARATATSTPASPRPDDPLSCPVCREVAHAGAYLTPGPIAFAVPVASGHWSPVAAPHALHANDPSHSWQSRAPPMSLHV